MSPKYLTIHPIFTLLHQHLDCSNRQKEIAQFGTCDVLSLPRIVRAVYEKAVTPPVAQSLSHLSQGTQSPFRSDVVSSIQLRAAVSGVEVEKKCRHGHVLSICWYKGPGFKSQHDEASPAFQAFLTSLLL